MENFEIILIISTDFLEGHFIEIGKNNVNFGKVFNLMMFILPINDPINMGKAVHFCRSFLNFSSSGR